MPDPDQGISLFEVTMETAQQNLALDELMLREVSRGELPACLRLWELPYQAVIAGRGNKLDLNVKMEACQEAGVPVIRRVSGGGTVILGPGCFVFSLYLKFPEEQHPGISEATRLVMTTMQRSLQQHVENPDNLQVAGISDLIYDGLKFSGNSQRWKKNCFLHHGTILYDFPIGLTERLLTKPEREPEYRAGRTHEQFVTNLPLSRETLREALVSTWNAYPDDRELPLEEAKQLAVEKYQDTGWNERL